jgi:cation diffusion facilitator CzcD-associated flavoprotein CzcO
MKDEVDVDVDGTIVHDWCNVIVNGTGFLNSWKWPKIEGLHEFSGKLLHSASWDPSVDWTGKTVAVIGTGSSAIQMVPRIQKTAKHLTAFMRSVTWISPAIGKDTLDAEKSKESTSGDGETVPVATEHAQYYYTDAEKKRFRDDPKYFLEYRKRLESNVNSLFDMFLVGSETSISAQKMMTEEMIRRLGPGNEDLAAKLIPKWSPGCRRITPGDGYLEALVKPNVTTVHKEISKIVPEGLVDEDGTLHKVDILACATGFNLAFTPPFEVLGSGGVSMAEEFDPEPYVYLGVTVPKFPNYFVVNGVRGNWAQGSALPSHEVQIEYILKCISKIQAEDIRAFEVKREPVVQLYQHIDEWHKRSVWNTSCKR